MSQLVDDILAFNASPAVASRRQSTASKSSSKKIKRTVAPSTSSGRKNGPTSRPVSGRKRKVGDKGSAILAKKSRATVAQSAREESERRLSKRIDELTKHTSSHTVTKKSPSVSTKSSGRKARQLSSARKSQPSDSTQVALSKSSRKRQSLSETRHSIAENASNEQARRLQARLRQIEDGDDGVVKVTATIRVEMSDDDMSSSQASQDARSESSEGGSGDDHDGDDDDMPSLTSTVNALRQRYQQPVVESEDDSDEEIPATVAPASTWSPMKVLFVILALLAQLYFLSQLGQQNRSAGQAITSIK